MEAAIDMMEWERIRSKALLVRIGNEYLFLDEGYLPNPAEWPRFYFWRFVNA